jgi:hypothetical protein
MHIDRPRTVSPVFMRSDTTFKKLPITAPRTKAKMSGSMIMI